MNHCYFLTQKNYSFGKLTGIRCKKDATVEETKNGRTCHFCKVHSYTYERFEGAAAGPGYIPA